MVGLSNVVSRVSIHTESLVIFVFSSFFSLCEAQKFKSQNKDGYFYFIVVVVVD